MSFANMNPADRMKASGLIGLIVVILFFVVHTFLGAIAPKKPTTPGQVDPGAGPGVAAPPAPASGPTVAGASAGTTTDAGFPTDKIASAKPGSLARSLDKPIPDPFVPISPKDRPGQLASGPRQTDPPIGLKETYGPSRTDGPGRRDLLPPLPGPGGQQAGGSTPFGPAPVTVVKIEPEIKVVGLVDGEPPIATVTVAGHSVLAHRGDALASGYRITDITPDGVQIRVGKERRTLRVGGVLNEKTDARAEAH